MSCNTPGMLSLFYYIKIAMTIIFIAAPIILLVLGAIDFLKVVTSGDEKHMKKSVDDFIKRVLICVIILILPLIINLVMSALDVKSYKECFANATKANIEKLDEEYKKKKEEEEKITPVTPTTPTNETATPLSIQAGTYERSDYDSEMRYVEVIPENATTNMPLIIYLHGIWAYASFSSTAPDYTITKYVKSGNAYNYGKFILIIPRVVLSQGDSRGMVTWQTSQGREQTTKLKGLIDFIVDKYKINSNKIIITGYSLGGDGTWNMVESYPNLFSAALPISGCAENSTVISNYTKTPIMAFHGTGYKEDAYKQCVPAIYNKIKNAGGNIQLITKNGYSHATMQNVYTDDNGSVFKWMLSQ